MTTESRRQAGTWEYIDITLERLRRPGLLLAAKGLDGGHDNAMAIGWATLGPIWGLEVFVAMVRPSRYTYGLIEAAQDFTVGVPGDGMNRAVGYLGRESGRDGDKLAAMGLQCIPSLHVAAPTIAACQVTYECRVVHHNDLVPAHLIQAIRDSSYPQGDFHRLYFGQILAVTTTLA